MGEFYRRIYRIVLKNYGDLYGTYTWKGTAQNNMTIGGYMFEKFLWLLFAHYIFDFSITSFDDLLSQLPHNKHKKRGIK